MNLRKTFILIAIAIAIIPAFYGYELTGVSIEERIQHFENDLNDADRDDAYLNFHPSRTADYGTITGDGQIFDDTFPPSERDYKITISDESNPNNIIGIIEADGVGFPTVEIYFKMAQDGSDWMIEELRLQGVADPIVE